MNTKTFEQNYANSVSIIASSISTLHWFVLNKNIDIYDDRKRWTILCLLICILSYYLLLKKHTIGNWHNNLLSLFTGISTVDQLAPKTIGRYLWNSKVNLCTAAKK